MAVLGGEVAVWDKPPYRWVLERRRLGKTALPWDLVEGVVGVLVPEGEFGMEVVDVA